MVSRRYGKRKSASRKRFKRRYKRNYRNRRRRYRRGSTALVERSRLGADQAVVTMHYTDEVNLTYNGTTRQAVTKDFCANGIYDPNLQGGTGIGRNASVLGFSEMTARFHHYFVVGSKIIVDYLPPSGTNQIPVYWGVIPSGGGTFISSQLNDYPFQLAKIREIYARYHLRWNPQKTDSDSAGSNRYAKATFSAKKVYGKNKYRDDTLCGSSGANPEEKHYFEIWAMGHEGSSVTTEHVLPFLVHMTFRVVWFERKLAPYTD